MTPAEQMLIVASELNAKVARARVAGEDVKLPAGAVRELAYFIEFCGRVTAEAGAIHRTSNPALAEYAHDIARTYLGK